MAAMAQPQNGSSPLDCSTVKKFENEIQDLKKETKRLQVFVQMIQVFEELNDGGMVEEERDQLEDYDRDVDVIHRTGIKDFEERIYDVLEEIAVPGEKWEQWMKDIHEWEIVWLNINEK
eukprot:248415_1